MRKFLNFLSNIQFLFKNKSLPGSLIIVSKKDRDRKLFLLIKSFHSNAITFPSGNLNPCEDFFEAAQRELLEETGLCAKKSELFLTSLTHNFKYKNLPLKVKSQQKVFLFSPTTKSLSFKPKDKDIEWVRWYNIAKTLSLLTYSELKNTLKKSLRYFA